MRKWPFILLIIVTLWATAACGRAKTSPETQSVGKPVQVDGGAYMDLTVEELEQMLKHKDFVFVNVHIPFEGNIHSTDLSIPYDQIGQHLDQLPADKNARIVLYCRSGRMSAIAAQELVKAGFTHVYNLAGGFAAWEQAGLPLEGK